MARPTKEERAAAVADREWRKVIDEHAANVVASVIKWSPYQNIRNADDQGGHVVEIRGPDGEWRRYFLRLTEVRA